MEKKLTPKERMFVLEYLLDLDPCRAAKAAGFSATVASSKAYQWVSNSKVKPNVYEAVQAAIGKRAARTERSADEVVKALWEMAELDIAYFMAVDDGGAVTAVPLDQIPPEKRKYINKIKGKRTIRESADGGQMSMQDETEYTIPEKKGTYELLARHYGILVDKKELNVKGEISHLLQEIDGTTLGPPSMRDKK
jgi:hypothetical protein